ncbi:DUF1015 domain-containing protein [Streptomyces sp. AN091965]|uniref:DUF1015 domain-containing protein n=1 Tax=Streptomyces sp. AN091965 TaxID=2927803 RepID=UPI001F61A223|nr:DUF1015 domain-containing protein [Streptomyces sp. AN091965]MCI3935258.1 DUF1015 domain-containing protein [Streptomyces sp. AN091965]
MSTSDPTEPGPTPPRLRPFRAVRYDEDRAGDLSALVAPPHDDLEPAHARSQRVRPHHIARLIYASDPQAAAGQLQRWLRRGVLRRDEHPALYVYQQQRGARILQRGVIGELPIPHPGGAARDLLPHEDVSAHVVRQRAAHMAGLRAQLEPLLLTYRGTRSTATQITHHITRRTPTAVARVGDTTHLVWACHDEAETALLSAGVETGQALIADGHHRHAACLRLGAERSGPWASSLALFVDTVAYPPRLAAIHRVLPGLDPEKAASAAAEVARVRRLPQGPRPPGPDEMVLVGGGGAWAVSDPEPGALRDALAGRPPQWAALPSAVSDHLLIGVAWSVPELPGAVRHHHDAAGAVAAVAAPGRGSAVLLPALGEERVRELARVGVLLPRKSTSFGPKPAIGLALRVLGLS